MNVSGGNIHGYFPLNQCRGNSQWQRYHKLDVEGQDFGKDGNCLSNPQLEGACSLHRMAQNHTNASTAR